MSNVAALTAIVLLAASSAGRPAAMQELEIATSVSMLEGPTVDADGNVYFTDILMQRIMRFSRSGEFSIFRENSNVANGLVIDPQGRLVAAEGAASPTAERSGMKTGGTPRVTRTDLKTGRMEILADAYAGKPLSGPNDVTLDGRGRLYFTDSSGAAVYRIDAAHCLRVSANCLRRGIGVNNLLRHAKSPGVRS
jgi:gluconolactonase